MPDIGTIKKNKFLKIFGKLLHSQNLWILNRVSVAKAFAVGLFMAFMPVPFQMVFAAGAAILINANLPLSVALVWITNPVTIPFIFYICYLVGDALIGKENDILFEANLDFILSSFSALGPPFMLGCFVMALLFSISGYMIAQGAWIYSVKKAWKKRIKNRES